MPINHIDCLARQIRCHAVLSTSATWPYATVTIAVHAACYIVGIPVYTALLFTQHCYTDGIAVHTAVRTTHVGQDKDYTAAAQLAFELKQPGRLLAVVNKACEAGPTKAHPILTNLVGELSEEELKLCLEYIRDWNTNSRHCSVAQAMLQAILVKHQPQVKACAVQLNSFKHLMQSICSTFGLWCF